MKLIIAEKKELAEDIAAALDTKYGKYNNYLINTHIQKKNQKV